MADIVNIKLVMNNHPAFLTPTALSYLNHPLHKNAISSSSPSQRYTSTTFSHKIRRVVNATKPTTPTCSMRPYLEALVQRQDLTTAQAQAAIDYAVSGEAHDAEIAGLLCLLSAKGETSNEITGVVNALRSRMIAVPYAEGSVLDIVGTGGDGANTVNISTAASIVAAAAGCRVGKHGNRSVSSKSGSADVLEALGIELSLSPEGVVKCMDDSGIGFMFAPNHHPCLKVIGPIRKALQIPTVFNIVGPFVNPCGAKHAVIGVYKPELLDIAADVLIDAGVERGVVVHTEGLDEFSNTGIANIVEISKGGMKHSRHFDPVKELGMKKVGVEDLKGGDAEVNAGIIRDVLAGRRNDAITDAIALNAAAGCWVYGLDDSISDAMERVRAVLTSGAALETLEKWSVASRANKRK